MGKLRRKKNALATISEPAPPAQTVEESIAEESNLEVAMDNAKGKVVETLSSAEVKKKSDSIWSDRPEHLKKPLGQMSDQEKIDYYLWKAKQLAPNKSIKITDREDKPAQESYTADDFKLLVMGANFFIQQRWGDFYALDSDEIIMWCDAIVPIANKFMALPEWALVFKPLMACAGAYAGKRFMVKLFSNALGNNADRGNTGNGQNYTYPPAASTPEASLGSVSV